MILVAGMWAFPHSPRWLADKGRMDDAIRVLADIHGAGDPNHPRVKQVLGQKTINSICFLMLFI